MMGIGLRIAVADNLGDDTPSFSQINRPAPKLNVATAKNDSKLFHCSLV